MLASRLAARDGIRIMDYSLSQKELDEIKSSKKQELAKGLFTRLHADYLATGSIVFHGQWIEFTDNLVFGLSWQQSDQIYDAGGKRREDFILA